MSGYSTVATNTKALKESLASISDDLTQGVANITKSVNTVLSNTYSIQNGLDNLDVNLVLPVSRSSKLYTVSSLAANADLDTGLSTTHLVQIGIISQVTSSVTFRLGSDANSYTFELRTGISGLFVFNGSFPAGKTIHFTSPIMLSELSIIAFYSE